ncbi:tryptophan synthase subunit alpha [Halanaerobium hydrogeniformans]|uniref:tryptophan synthase n=1 Tax=Halanaerobium hydrogeniformans TaxID=656519 RepID=E4RM31_HALHG|nr:tryptophan synthase subunit alpha [Halanaerobium hydrogeniformans]ADQ14114.1 tryptophan synthase, alpha subunit [Halanaerobium hydrogeniformans]
MDNKELSQYLKEKKAADKAILVAYLPALYPDYERSKRWINLLFANGVDAVELGYPARDSSMDGQIITEANQKLYQVGFNAEKYLKLAADINSKTEINRLILMGYWKELKKEFFSEYKKQCLETGIESLILPDLKDNEDKKYLQAEGFKIISFLDKKEKIKSYQPDGEPFVYCPSYLGKTGQSSEFDYEHLKNLKKALANSAFALMPQLVGFGISSAEDAAQVMELGYDGIIVGSALLNKFEESEAEAIEFLRELKKGLNKEWSYVR